MHREVDTIKRVSMVMTSPIGFSLPIDVEIPDMMITLADLVPPIQNLTDSVVSLAIKEHTKTGKAVSCKAGCASCCNQLIPLSVPEVFYIMDHIRRFPKPRQMKTIDRFKEVYKVITDNNLIDRLKVLVDDKDHPRDPSISRKYFEMGCPCPFLEDQSCAIHEIRPIVCREYNVSSDPKHCGDPYHHKIDIINLYNSNTKALAEVASRVLEQPRMLVLMPMIFDWYRENYHLSKIERHAEALFEELFIKIIGKSESVKAQAEIKNP
jgi:Fe-S-cluster containining protein